MGKETDEGQTVMCPVGKFFSDLEGISGEKSQFFEHLSRSRVEFLKAIRSLVDEKIDSLENKNKKKSGKKATKIKVE